MASIKRTYNNKAHSVLAQIKHYEEENPLSSEENYSKLYNNLKPIVANLNSGSFKTIVVDKTTTTAFNKNLEKETLKENTQEVYKKIETLLFDPLLKHLGEETLPGKQTPKDLQAKSIDKAITFAENMAQSNTSYTNAIKALDKIQLSNNVIAYDLETLGGTKGNIWSPSGITEFSFQQFDAKAFLEDQKEAIKNGEQLELHTAGVKNKYIKQYTAITSIDDFSGLEKDLAIIEDLLNNAENNPSKKQKLLTDKSLNHLKVTAERLQLYGMLDFGNQNDYTKSLGKDLILDEVNNVFRIKDLPGEEVYFGGLDIYTIKKGLNNLKTVNRYYKQLSTNLKAKGIQHTNDLRTMDKVLMHNMIGKMKDRNAFILGFNDMGFDLSVLNNQVQKQAQHYLNKFYETQDIKYLNTFQSFYSDVTGNNISGINKLSNVNNQLQLITAVQKQESIWLNNLKVEKNQDQRLDAYGIIKETAQGTGITKLFGNLNNDKKYIGIRNLLRQENIAEKLFPDYMFDDDTLRHEASYDVLTLMKVLFEKSNALKDKNGKPQSMLDISKNVLEKNYSNSNILKYTKDDFKDKVFMANGGMYDGTRHPLAFSFNSDVDYKTTLNNVVFGMHSEYMVSKDGVDVSNASVGSNIKKGFMYKVADISEITPENEIQKLLTQNIPEYGGGKLYSIALEGYVPEEIKNQLTEAELLNATKKHVFFVNELSAVESFLGNNLSYIGQENVMMDVFDINNYDKDIIKKKKIKTGEKVEKLVHKFETEKYTTVNDKKLYRNHVKKIWQLHKDGKISDFDLRKLTPEKKSPLGILDVKTLFNFQTIDEVDNYLNDILVSKEDKITFKLSNKSLKSIGIQELDFSKSTQKKNYTGHWVDDKLIEKFRAMSIDEQETYLNSNAIELKNDKIKTALKQLMIIDNNELVINDEALSNSPKKILKKKNKKNKKETINTNQTFIPTLNIVKKGESVFKDKSVRHQLPVIDDEGMITYNKISEIIDVKKEIHYILDENGNEVEIDLEKYLRENGGQKPGFLLGKNSYKKISNMNKDNPVMKYIKKKPVQVESATSLVNDYALNIIKSSTTETALNAFNRNGYKNTIKYNEIVKAVAETHKLKTDNIEMTSELRKKVYEALVNADKHISQQVTKSKGGAITDLDSKIIKIIGYEDINSKKKHIFKNTTRNFIQLNDILADTFEFNNMVVKSVDESKSNIIDESNSYLNTKFNIITEQAKEYILRQNPDLIEEIKNPKIMTDDYLSSVFQFHADKLVVTNQKIRSTTINRNLSNKNLTNLYLGGTDKVNSIIKIAKELQYGSRDIKSPEEVTYAMRNVIEVIAKQNRYAFANNPILKELLHNSQNNDILDASEMAAQLLHGLNKEKQKNAKFGIKDKTLSFTNPNEIFTIDKIREHVKNFNDYKGLENFIQNSSDVLVINRTPEAIEKSLTSNVVRELVDEYYMPTIKKDGTLLKGKEAKEELFKNLTDDDKKYFSLIWNKNKEEHENILTKLIDVVSEVGGTTRIDVETGLPTIDINGQSIDLLNIPKTEYYNNTLMLDIGGQKIKTGLDLDYNKSEGYFDFKTTMTKFTTGLDKFKYILDKAETEGNITVADLRLFEGKVSAELRRESTITGFNSHEQRAVKNIGYGNGIGKFLQTLYDSNGNVAVREQLGGYKPIQHNLIELLEERLTMIGPDRAKNIEGLDETFREILVKDMPGIVKHLIKKDKIGTITENLEQWIAHNVGFGKDDDVGTKSNSYMVFGKNGYFQNIMNLFDPRKRPTMYGAKESYSINKFKKNTDNLHKIKKDLNIKVGNLIYGEGDIHRFEDSLVDTVNSISVNKANLSMMQLSSLLTDQKNGMKGFKEDADVTELDKKIAYAALQHVNLYEQEKILDARVADATFNKSFNYQNLSNTKNIFALLERDPETLTEEQNETLKRLNDVTLEFNITKNGDIEILDNNGVIVKRGDTVLNYSDDFTPDGKVVSKSLYGRLEHIVTNKQNVRATNEEVIEYLKNNNFVEQLIAKGVTINNKSKVTKAAMEFLKKEHNVTYRITDLAQKTYFKVMDSGVEKDMTVTLHTGLGKFDDKVKSLISDLNSEKSFHKNFEGMDSEKLLNVVLYDKELERLKNSITDEYAQKHGFDSSQDALDAIMKERYTVTDAVMNIEALKGVSLIGNNQVLKHGNEGLIANGAIGTLRNEFNSLNGYNTDKEFVDYLNEKQISNRMFKYDDKEDKIILTSKLHTQLDTDDYGSYNLAGIDMDKYIKTGEIDLDNINGYNPLNDATFINLENLKNEMKKEEYNLYHKVKNWNFEKKNYEETEVFGKLIKVMMSDTNKNGQITDVITYGSINYLPIAQSVDIETYTSYEADVQDSLIAKRSLQETILKLQKELTNPNIKPSKQNRIKNKIEDLKIQINDIDNELGSSADNLRTQKFGRQEFRMFNAQQYDYAVEKTINNFINKGNEDPEKAALKKERIDFLDNMFDKEMDFSDKDNIKIIDKFKNKRILSSITDDYLMGIVYSDTDTDFATMKDNDEYKHLNDVYDRIKNVLQNRLETKYNDKDIKVGLKYVEEIYDAENLMKAIEFNNNKNSSIQKMTEDGTFKISKFTIDTNNMLDPNGKEFNLVSMFGKEAEKLGMDSIYNSNNLIFIGDFRGSKDVNDAANYLAVPRGGMLLGESTVNTMSQDTLKAMYTQYYDAINGNITTEQMQERVEKLMVSYNNLLHSETYAKNGQISKLTVANLGDVYRGKLSALNELDVTLDKSAGGKARFNEFIESDYNLDNKRMFGGETIADLKAKGFRVSYGTASEDIFELMGYFNEDSLKTLSYKKDGKEMLKLLDSTEIEYNEKDARELMKHNLRTYGSTQHVERYPAIKEDSATGITMYLDDGIAENKNRIRFDRATALKLNADFDGDSATFKIINKKAELQAQRNIRLGRTTDNIKGYNQVRAMQKSITLDSMSKNLFFEHKARTDNIEEIGKSLYNGTLSDSIFSTEYANLTKGNLYMQTNGYENMEVAEANYKQIEQFKDKYRKAIDSANISKENRQKIDFSNQSYRDFESLGKYNDKVLMAEHFDNIFNVLQTTNDSNNTIEIANKLGISENEAKQFKKSLSENMSSEDIERFRGLSLARTMWYTSLDEAQSKGRKGAIGTVNTVMQDIRAAGQIAFLGSGSPDHMREKYYLSYNIADALEQEVISAKHGSIVENVTKSTDLSKMIRSFIGKKSVDKKLKDKFFTDQQISVPGEKELKSVLYNYIDDKTAEKIYDRMEISNRTYDEGYKKYIPNGSNKSIASAKREYVIDQAVSGMAFIRDNTLANNTFERISKVGRAAADINSIQIDKPMVQDGLDLFTHIVSPNIDIDKFRELSNTNIDNNILDEKLINPINDGKAAKLVSDFAEEVFTGNGGGGLIAKAAIGIGVGIMAAGFAGNMTEQISAQQVHESSVANQSLTLMDNDNINMQQMSQKGYIINVKGTTNKDMRQTRKTLNNAINASNKGVNVTMNIKDSRSLNNDEKIENWVSGLS